MFTVARVKWPEGDEQFFASLDGKLFLGVDRKPTSKDEKDIEALFDVTGPLPRTLPMRVTRSLLAGYGAEFTEVGRKSHDNPHDSLQKNL